MDLENTADSGQGLSCTQCSNPLKAIRTPDRITVHSCVPCRTVWLDGGAIADAGWGVGLPEPEATQQTQRICPRCSQELLGLAYQTSRGEMSVDYCESCSGMSVEQGKIDALRELAASTRATGAQPGEGGEQGDMDGLSGERAPIRHVAPEPESSSSPAMVIIALLAVVALGGAYFLWQSGVVTGQPASTQEKPLTLRHASTDSGAIYSTVPALKKFFEENERWPNDAEELDRFAKERGLSFDFSKFEFLTWDEKQNGGLILKWRSKGAAEDKTFHVGPPAVKKDANG